MAPSRREENVETRLLRYSAVLFDLLTALLDSWTLWSVVAGSEAVGLAWRTRYLQLTYAAGAYRPYEGVIRQAAREVGVPEKRAAELVQRWGELEPWPEAPGVVGALLKRVPVAVVTNASNGLARVALARLGVDVPTLITAEEAGYYKPHPRPYRLALSRLDSPAPSALFVAGSAPDVAGAAAVGMTVFWHNRRRLSPLEGRPQPRYAAASLRLLPELVCPLVD